MPKKRTSIMFDEAVLTEVDSMVEGTLEMFKDADKASKRRINRSVMVNRLLRKALRMEGRKVEASS